MRPGSNIETWEFIGYKQQPLALCIYQYNEVRSIGIAQMVDSIYQIATCKLIAMELNREHFRAMIFYDFKVGLSESQCVDRLQSAFRDSAPSRATVFRWFGEFKRGRGSVEDEKRSGRPASAVTDENIVAVQQMIKEDQRCTYKDIEGALGISSPSVNEILHEKLGVRKLAARWVPHNLSEEQKRVRVNWCREMLERFNKGDSRRIFDIVTGDESWIYQYDPETKRQSTVWVFPDDAPPVKVKRGRSVGKKMVASFFSASGHVVTVPLENQATVTAKWYVTICLPKLFSTLQERRPKTGLRGLLLHQDNASAHTARITKDFLAESTIQVLAHPPYSPDLAPCDYFLFPKVKNELRGRRFESPEEAVEAYERTLATIPKEEWRQCFSVWFHRMERCVQCAGEYFEKFS